MVPPFERYQESTQSFARSTRQFVILDSVATQLHKMPFFTSHLLKVRVASKDMHNMQKWSIHP